MAIARRELAPTGSLAAPPDPARALRHQTNNALQRIIAQVERSRLRDTPEGASLADDVQRRILLSAEISDTLFGFTAAPAPMARRLGRLAEATVALLSDDAQTIRTEVDVAGACPEHLSGIVMQAAYEMLDDAVCHGMSLRLVGRIVVRLHGVLGGCTELTVRNDGWARDPAQVHEEMRLTESLAAPFGGTLHHGREAGWTSARLSIPGSRDRRSRIPSRFVA